jgi:dienelactone hydrolase
MQISQSLTFLVLGCLLAFQAAASQRVKVVSHELDGVRFESTIVYPKSGDSLKPGVLMIPNWMGPSESSLEKAKKIAGDDYVVMMADVYGVNVRPTNGGEAGAAAGVLRNDRELMRARMAHVYKVFQKEAASVGMDDGQMAAIGFCFGGGCVLEFARTGASLDAVVSFHGDLLSPTLQNDSKDITAKVLVLHGAIDPYVPQSHVEEWIGVMEQTEADWQLVQYAGAAHSFTNPGAKSEGSIYHERTAKRSFAAMRSLFEEIWD